MSLSPGARLGPYEVTARIGVGGMGEVYQATDTRLKRRVAIKVLPESVASDPDRLTRFQREAEVLASLNHPHIAAIYGLEDADGAKALVMELVEGPTLADRIAQGAIPVDEAIAIARQIAEALEAAHEQRIIHRDLKPANVKVREDGTVKVLDFGLAKALESAPPASVANSQLSHSPTISRHATEAGMILGTAAYMSPEQARGKTLDRRTDIWAFGVVLFEMLTGRRAFPGEDLTDTLAAVVRSEPSWDALPDGLSPTLGVYLHRCLHKDPKQRLGDIRDMRLALEGAFETVSPQAVVPAAEVAPVWRRALPILTAMAVTGLIAGVAAWSFRGRDAAHAVVHASVRLPEGVRLAGWSSPAVALSPDEQIIAFIGFREGRQELYLRRLGEAEAVVVPDSDGAEGPFFSPDSRWVAFGAGSISGRSNEPRLLKRAPISGEPAQPIAPLTDYFGGSWGEDGFIYFVDSELKGQLLRVRAEGGDPAPVFNDSRGGQLADSVVRWPQHLPDGRSLLLAVEGVSGDGVAVLDLETGELRSAGEPATFARYAPGGHLITSRTDGLLRAVPFDPTASRTQGAPVTLVRDIAFTANGAAVFAVGGGGSALYVTGFVQGSDRVLSRLVRIDPSGQVEHLKMEPDVFTKGISLSPSGRQLVTATWDGSLWIYDLDRGTRLKLPETDRDGRRAGAIWSPDGKTIVFTSQTREQGGYVLLAQPADGSTDARPLTSGPGETWAAGWTPDGRDVLYSHWSGGDSRNYYRLAISEPGGATPVPMEVGGVVSPDGRWMAYQSDETGRLETYLRPYPEGGPVIPISNGGGGSPRWSAGGDELYYVRDCQFFAVRVRTSPEIRIGVTRPLFEHCDPMRRRDVQYDVGANGSFYMLEAVPDSGLVTSLELVLRWTDTLAAAFGAD